MIGSTIGPYVISAQLGEGAFAEVFLAEDKRRGLRRALKILRQACARDPLLVDRFRNEARCGEILRECAHIVRVHQVLEVGGCPALVMDYIDGQDLQQMLDSSRGRGLGVPRALRFIHDVAFALQFAHRHGICHRDVKPSNCLVERGTQRVYLSDFGIALRAGAKRVTRIAIGTREYMAPEVLRRGPGASAPQSDVYAAGVMLYEMLSGALPFDEDDEFALMQKVLTEPAPPPSQRAGQLPDGLDELVACCLAKEPGERFADGAALFDAILALRTAIRQTGGDAGYEPERAQAEGTPPVAVGVLIDVTDPTRPVPHPIPRQGLTIGFDPENRLVINHPRVSGQHATLTPLSGGRFRLADTSTNGTWVRGQRVQRSTAELGEGDVLVFGARSGAPRFVLVLL